MDLATKEVGSIHSSDGSLGILSLLKRDKREPSWLAAMRIVHYLCFLDSSILAKRLFKFAFGSAVAQARDVEIVTGVVVAVAAVSASAILVPGAHRRARSLALAAGRGSSASRRGAAAAVPGSIVGFASSVTGSVAVPLLSIGVRHVEL